MKVTVKNQVKVSDLKIGEAFLYGAGYYIVVDASLLNIHLPINNVVCFCLTDNRVTFLGKNLDVVQYGIEVVLTGHSL